MKFPIITGASGFVGQELIQSLGGVYPSGLAVSRKPIANLPKSWNWIQRDKLLGSSTPYPEACVIHLEVKQHVQNPTEKDIQGFEQVNVGGTRAWLDWCARNRVHHFMHFSTIKAVAPSGGNLPVNEAAIGPGDTPYGASKWRAEEAVRSWATEDASRGCIILRPAVVYGPGNQANVFSMVHAIARGYFFLAGPARNVKSLVSLKNVSSAVRHLMESATTGCHTFNLVDKQSYSVNDLSAIMSRALEVSRPRRLPLGLVRVLAGIGDVAGRLTGRNIPITGQKLNALLEETHFSCEKLLATGFAHPQTTEEGIQDLVLWYREKHGR